jgi:hypothetical protein
MAADVAVKRTWAQATDAMILERLRDGSLTVCLETGLAFSRGKQLIDEYDKRGRYRFYRIYCGRARKKIAVHRLVWMAGTMAEIPPDHEIHHKHGRGSNGFDTLECLTIEEHAAITYAEWAAPVPF